MTKKNNGKPWETLVHHYLMFVESKTQQIESQERIPGIKPRNVNRDMHPQNNNTATPKENKNDAN